MRHPGDQTPERLARIEAHRARVEAESASEPNESTNESPERREGRLSKEWTYHLKRRAEGIAVA